MSRRSDRILFAREKEQLIPILSLLRLGEEKLSQRALVVIYEAFCTVPRSRLENSHTLEDQTLLLIQLMRATLTLEYTEAVDKEMAQLQDCLGDIQRLCYGINWLLKKEVKKC